MMNLLDVQMKLVRKRGTAEQTRHEQTKTSKKQNSAKNTLQTR